MCILTKLWASVALVSQSYQQKSLHRYGKNFTWRKASKSSISCWQIRDEKNQTRKVTMVVIWLAQAWSQSILPPWWCSPWTHPIVPTDKNLWASCTPSPCSYKSWLVIQRIQWDCVMICLLGKENPGLETGALLSLSQGSWECLVFWVHVPELVVLCYNI